MRGSGVVGAFLAMASTSSAVVPAVAQDTTQIAAAQPESCLDCTGTNAELWKTVCGLAQIRKGDKAGGEADRPAARALYAGTDREFAGNGLN